MGDLGLIPELGRSPGGGHGNPLQYSCLENPHGQRNLVGYDLWGAKELDMTEQLSTAYYPITIFLIVLGLLSVFFFFCFLPREVPLALVVKRVCWG